MGFLIPGSLVRVQPGVLVDWRARMPAPANEPEVRKRSLARRASGAENEFAGSSPAGRIVWLAGGMPAPANEPEVRKRSLARRASGAESESAGSSPAGRIN